MKSNRPNVLFIMSDQHNANCMSGTGKPSVRTPVLDGLAESGVRFDRAYCNSPICAPSRISFFRGQYCHTHGMLGNRVFEHPGDTPDTMSMHFRKYGCQTALIGKAHMVRKWDNAGFEHIRYCDLADADRNDVLSNHYFKYLVDHGLADMYEDGALPPENDCMTKDYGVGKLPYEHAIEHWTAQETLEFLKHRDTTRPFFVHMSFERPHPNPAPAPEDADLYDPDAIVLPDCIADAYQHEFASKPPFIREQLLAVRKPKDHLQRVLAAYYTLITAIDREIGRILDALKKRGELENTIILYTADHGDSAGEHGAHGKNIGIYESVHRIPFILKCPDCPRGAVKDGLIESVDLYPSLCELCALPVPDHVEGRSILPIIRKDSPGKEFALAEWDWWSPYPRAHTIRTRDFRLVYYDAEHGGELYHNAEDPGEIENLWDDPDFRDVRMQLMERLFDQVARYAKLSNGDTDLDLIEKHKTGPTVLIHKRLRKWSEVKKFCYD